VTKLFLVGDSVAWPCDGVCANESSRLGLKSRQQRAKSRPNWCRGGSKLFKKYSPNAHLPRMVLFAASQVRFYHTECLEISPRPLVTANAPPVFCPFQMQIDTIDNGALYSRLVT